MGVGLAIYLYIFWYFWQSDEELGGEVNLLQSTNQFHSISSSGSSGFNRLDSSTSSSGSSTVMNISCVLLPASPNMKLMFKCFGVLEPLQVCSFFNLLFLLNFCSLCFVLFGLLVGFPF